ncbi:TIGR00730 family Rossman fold protein [Candidatus Saccharibacteria bacterium]|nr:TIGR00730 family Rossman fold protein [Candidatus Saccharibacteria bacterium]
MSSLESEGKWIKEIQARHELSVEEIERSLHYARDLLSGREFLEKYDQGVTIFGSARSEEGSEFYEKAKELGRRLAESGQIVTTGGGPGIMEAASRGALEAGGTVLGLNITLPFEQKLNNYTTDSMEFRYFFARKVMLVDSGKAFVYFPGGIGTLDEFTEVIELLQNDKMPNAPVFLFGSEYWQPLMELLKHFVVTGMMGQKDLDLVKTTDDIEEVVTASNAAVARRLHMAQHHHGSYNPAWVKQ